MVDNINYLARAFDAPLSQTEVLKLALDLAFAAGAEAMREAAARAAAERGAWASNDLDADSLVDRLEARGRMDMASEVRDAIRSTAAAGARGMSDIVERLREWSASDMGTHASLRRCGVQVAEVPWSRHGTDLGEVVADAAAEIERLRAALRDIASTFGDAADDHMRRRARAALAEDGKP